MNKIFDGAGQFFLSDEEASNMEGENNLEQILLSTAEHNRNSNYYPSLVPLLPHTCAS